MIQISKAQLAGLDAAAEAEFIDRLVNYLSERNPCVLPRFDDQVRPRIVRCMVERAQRWGVTWEASLAMFADLMQTVAPNFARFPDIQQQLTVRGRNVNETVLEINQLVPRDLWKSVEAKRVTLGMFHSPELDRAPLTNRVGAAVPLVLWDKVEELTVPVIVDAGFQKSKLLGFAGLDDGPLVSAVGAALYGDDFLDPKVHSWVGDLMAEQRPQVRLEMLRFRISLDFGRRA